MLKLSKEEIGHLIKTLIEWQAKLERVPGPYPLRKSDIRPYKALTRKLVEYRKEHWGRKTKRATKR